MNSETAVPAAIERRGRHVGIAVAAAMTAVAIVVAMVALVGRAQAVDLPPEKPDTLLASLINSLRGEPSLVGQASARVDLGLPQLPRNIAPQGDPFSGDHTFRIAVSPDGAKVAELLEDGERSVVMNARSHEVWTWDSRTVKATHYVGSDAEHRRHHDRPADAATSDPLELARRTLAEITDTTNVSVRPPVRVAGRDSYVLVVEPKTDATLVRSVEIAVDADTRLPLRVEVYGRGQTKPAITAGFTSITFGPVDAATFEFNPPDGADVVDGSKGAPSHKGTHGADHAAMHPAGDGPAHASGHRGDDGDVRTFGDGWTEVTAFKVTPPDRRRAKREFDGLFPFSGPLVSAIKVERGGDTWVLIGAVPPAALEGAAAQL